MVPPPVPTRLCPHTFVPRHISAPTRIAARQYYCPWTNNNIIVSTRLCVNLIVENTSMPDVVKDTGWRNSIPVRLSTEWTPCYMLFVALRNKFILVVTYGKAPCFYFLERP